MAGTDVSATAFYIDRSYKRGFHAHCFAFLLAIHKPLKRINAVTRKIYRQKCQYPHSEKGIKKAGTNCTCLFLDLYIKLLQFPFLLFLLLLLREPFSLLQKAQ